MKRFYCPECEGVRRTRRAIKASKSIEHRTAAGSIINVPVQLCGFHSGLGRSQRRISNDLDDSQTARK